MILLCWNWGIAKFQCLVYNTHLINTFWTELKDTLQPKKKPSRGIVPPSGDFEQGAFVGTGCAH